MKTLKHIKNRFQLLVVVITHLFNYQLRAQDVLVKTDSSKTEVHVDEISAREIKYRLHNYLDGPKFTIIKTEVAYIRYKNGLIERFAVNAIAVNKTPYDPNKYNMDAAIDPVIPCTYKKAADATNLYARKNYLGVNYLAFLNTCIGFNYMRDFRKQNLILDVSFAFGVGKPNMSNAFYGNNYLAESNTNAHYALMRYQGGVSLLFSPAMTTKTNFLIGPSFSYTSFNVDVETEFVAGTVVTTYTNTSASPSYTYNVTETIREKFENQFVLNRSVYGMSLGFLARTGERINLNGLMTFGIKSDNYNQEDPYGLEYIKQHGGKVNEFDYKYNAKPYFNVSLSVGYRF